MSSDEPRVATAGPWPNGVRLVAERADRAHALTIDHHRPLDDATPLAKFVAEAADDPHLLSHILRNGDVYRPRFDNPDGSMTR